MKKLRPCLAILALILMGHNSAQALENECGANAQIDGASYILSPSGGDDTATIQCALDSAVSQGIPTVRLDRGSFYTDELRTYGFKGTFTGTSRNDSILLVNNNIADCETPFPIIAFIGGDVQVRSMTIDTDNPCVSGDKFIALAVTQESCSKRTVFALVDRVDFVNSSSGLSTAIRMTGIQDCLDQGKWPLGTLKVNRSTVTNFFVGVHSSLYGAGQVDINFNEFSGVGFGVYIVDADQSTTITGNQIDFVLSGVTAITLSSYAASKNRTVVHRNTLNQLIDDGQAEAIIIGNQNSLAAHSAVITENTLNLRRNESRGYYQLGVVVKNIDGALISGNDFRGSASRAIELTTEGFRDDAENNAILGNSFQLSTGVDIYIGSGNRNTVVGSQNATYINNGINSLIGP